MRVCSKLDAATKKPPRLKTKNFEKFFEKKLHRRRHYGVSLANLKSHIDDVYVRVSTLTRVTNTLREMNNINNYKQRSLTFLITGVEITIYLL